MSKLTSTVCLIFAMHLCVNVFTMSKPNFEKNILLFVSLAVAVTSYGISS